MEKVSLYQRFLAERDEILKHKWIESEKAGHDVGFEVALLDWMLKHRKLWSDMYDSSVKSDHYLILN